MSYTFICEMSVAAWSSDTTPPCICPLPLFLLAQMEPTLPSLIFFSFKILFQFYSWHFVFILRMPIFCIFVQILHLNFLVQYSHRCAHCSHLQLYNSDASLFLQCLLQYGEDKLNVTVIYGSPYTFKLLHILLCYFSTQINCSHLWKNY